MAAMDGTDYGYREAGINEGGTTYRKLEGSEKTRHSIQVVSQRIERKESDLKRHEENWGRGSTNAHSWRCNASLEREISEDKKILNELVVKLAKQLKEEARQEEERKEARLARMEELVWDGEVRDEDVEEARERRGLEVSEDGRVRAMW